MPISGGGGILQYLTPTAPTTTTLDSGALGSGASLDVTKLILTGNSSGGSASSRSVASHASGKYYAEATYTAAPGSFDLGFGVANASEALTGFAFLDNNGAGQYSGDTRFLLNGSALFSWGVAPAQGDVIGIAVDIGAGKIWARINGGTWNNDGAADPATGTNGANIAAITGSLYALAWCGGSTTQSITVNFGATSYANAAPSGFGNW